jgi:hypothetical protein
MNDRISVRVEFKKALWICPFCSQEDIEDLNVSGGNKYEHECSSCGKWFNSFKSFSSALTFPYETYPEIKKEDIDAEKTRLCEQWSYSIKNPPPVVEPTKQQLEAEKAELEARIAILTAQISAKGASIG